MSLSTSPELFINMKSIPDRGSQEYDDFFKNEEDKIRYGVTINGVYLHGWLYWHLNHWHIHLDEQDPRNPMDTIRVFRNPDFRDNEWLIAENIKKAEEEKKGLLIFGTRRFSKTQIEASWIGRGATIYKGSENVLSSTNSDDIRLLSNALEKGLGAVHPHFYFDRLTDNWNKEVTFGFKDKKGKRYPWSHIYIRNLDEGRNTEAVAGTTPKTFVLDEIGKANFAEALEAAIPGFTSPFGWRCVPILTGTGGSFIKNSDAQKFLEEPEVHNFLAFEIPGKKKKYGLFVPGTYRMEAKVQTTLGTFLQRKSGILVPEDSELNTIPFFESDEEKAKQIIQEEVDAAKKSRDSKAELKARMYFPMVIDDCFLVDSDNNFPIEAIEEHIKFLEQTEYGGQFVKLYKDSSGVVKKSFDTTLKPIMEYPVDKNSDKDACVVIYEDPMPNPPAGLYIAGGDPYNQETSTNSTSLGTLYIYKRAYDPVGGTFQDRIVASYAARPDLMNRWHETVEMLLEFYNAVCLPENEGRTFIQWFDQRNKIHYLADGYNLLKEISPNSSTSGRTKGLPATVSVKRHYMNLMLEYFKEELIVGYDPVTKEPIKKLGLIRIPDIMLLKEALAYSKDANVDRIVAFGHVLAYDSFLKKYFPIVNVPVEEERKAEEKRIRSPFVLGKASPFAKTHNPFA